MKIVVTGAIGHIGSYVIRDLAVQFPGAEIVIIDNMMTQRFPSLFNLPALGKGSARCDSSGGNHRCCR
jgi:UDP-glucose 4-epimerase